jgi:hypothetical protein
MIKMTTYGAVTTTATCRLEPDTMNPAAMARKTATNPVMKTSIRLRP